MHHFSIRAVIGTVMGGALMGVANIIPGVSGGTIILALGLYEQFVQAVSDVTRLRFRLASVAFLVILGVSALLAIGISVGPITWGLTHYQHLMFALFIGLTLGGVPLIWKEIRPVGAAGWSGIVVGFAVMILSTAALQNLNLPVNFILLFVGGIVGSAAMVLPGISGSYILLAMGLYTPITLGIDAFKDAAMNLDVAAAMDPALDIILPVGLGVFAGIALLSNILKALLRVAHTPTMGFLLGLLLGSVVFLYPFKAPGNKDLFEAAAPLTPLNLVLVLVSLAAGFGLTYAIAKYESKSQPEEAQHVTPAD